ncbi:MAG: NAD-dependent succinate-semialdehyde dehydrogenase [Pseudomonadota bacterium]|nr:MAG: NADP-dependent succinic semialdehyde dehydrogenase [Pseudomonadota bacterium]
MPIASVDPRTGETRATFEALDEAAIDAKLALAARAFRTFRKTSFAERAAILERAADLLEAEKEALGRLMTEEMGKTLVSAIAEAEKCARACRYYAEHGAAMLADRPVSTEAAASYVRHLPLGPVLAVMPWNFPFWQVFRFAAPALMAGNVGLLKHASNVPRCALAIEDLLRRAGLPEGAFQTLLIGADTVARVLRDSRVVAATLTGSTGAGAAVASEAGKHIKPTVLELGGSDAFIVMPSANLDEAVKTGVFARILNNGQSCINAKRFIVHADVYAAFEERLVAAFEALRVGDPMARETDVGPLAMASVRNDVVNQVEATVRKGARRLTGATAIEGNGFWFRPGVLADIPEGSPAFEEEVFGPVALLFRAKDIDHAIALANNGPFGLGSSVWTRDPGEQRRFIDELEAGQTFVNAMVASDPRLPFGGVKQSGYGRELSTEGIRAFVNLKTVFVAQGTPGNEPTTE